MNDAVERIADLLSARFRTMVDHRLSAIEVASIRRVAAEVLDEVAKDALVTRYDVVGARVDSDGTFRATIIERSLPKTRG